MSAKKLYLFEYLSLEGLVHFGDTIGAILLWGLLSIILFSLLSFAFVQPSDSDHVEYHDPFLMEEKLLGDSPGYVSCQSCASPFWPGIFALLLFFQYLRSHIGEKQPTDIGSILRYSFVELQTALFYSAVCAFDFRQWWEMRERSFLFRVKHS